MMILLKFKPIIKKSCVTAHIVRIRSAEEEKEAIVLKLAKKIKTVDEPLDF